MILLIILHIKILLLNIIKVELSEKSVKILYI